MPANWDQEVKLARAALQAEVLAELGDHPANTNGNGMNNAGSGNGNSNVNGNSNGNSNTADQNQGQGQSQELSPPIDVRETPLGVGLARGQGLMKQYSPSEQAAARKRAGKPL